MKKFLLGLALAIGFVYPVSALTTHKPSDWVPNGDLGSAEVISENSVKLSGASNYGPFSKASKEKLSDGITEETYIDLNFDNIANDGFFEVTLGLQNAKNEYVTEAVVISQRVGDKVVVTAGWAPEFKAEVTESGIYTYRWDMYVKSDGIAYVVFTILEGDKTIGSTGEVSLDSEEAKGPDTKSPVAEQEDVSVKYLWFCNIQTDGLGSGDITVYSKLPGAENATLTSSTDSGLNIPDKEKVNDILKKALENLAIEGLSEDTAVNFDIKATALEAKEEVATQFKETLKENKVSATIANYFDIAILVKDAITDEDLASITELEEKIELIINIPEDIPQVSKGYERTYYILREHNGKVDILPANIVEKGTALSFTSDLFSTYALAYEDKLIKAESNITENNEEVANTLDNVPVYLAIASITVLSLASIIIVAKKGKLTD